MMHLESSACLRRHMLVYTFCSLHPSPPVKDMLLVLAPCGYSMS